MLDICVFFRSRIVAVSSLAGSVPLSPGPANSQYRVSALSKVGADQLTFPDQDNGGQDEIVAKYFGQKYFKLRVREREGG